MYGFLQEIRKKPRSADNELTDAVSLLLLVFLSIR
jgi:hypothetical protein